MSNAPSKSTHLKNVLRFLISFGIAGGIFWYLYGSNFKETLGRLREVEYTWILLSIVLGIAGHILRAYRWNLLLLPTGYRPALWRTLAALFLGYFANLALPRLGEVTRCLSLKKTNNIPLTISFGTVVSERILDVVILGLIAGISLMVEFEKLNEFFRQLFSSKISSGGNTLLWLAGGIFIFLGIMALLWWAFGKRMRKLSWWARFRQILGELGNGLTSIFRVKQQFYFWGSTLLIWIMYFLMSYVVFYSIDATSELGWRAALSLLVMGGLAMSAPVQGGIGAYHYLVSALLIYYGIGKDDGLFFAFILHSSQTVLVIVGGLISLLVVWGIQKKLSAKSPAIVDKK